MHVDLCLEDRSRDEIFLIAAAMNDIKTLRRCIGNGQDLEVRSSSSLADLFLEYWTDLCEGTTQFFEISHDEESLRPTAVHLAIFFHAIEALEVLLYAGARAEDSTCWFSFVKVNEELAALVYDEIAATNYEVLKRASDNPRYTLKFEYDSLELLEAVFTQNICR